MIAGAPFRTPEVIRDRLMIQFIRRGVLYATEDHFVFSSQDGGGSWKKVCKLGPKNSGMAAVFRDSLLRSGTVRRFRRNIGIHNLVVLNSGTIIIQYDGIYRFDGSSPSAQMVFSFRQDNAIGPLKNGLCLDESSGKIFFGEYNNQRPYAVRIFRGSDDGRRWEVCYKFPEGRIKHVHSIIPDPYRRRLWICTGDADHEIGLFYTDDDFNSVHLFKGGDQSWRMIGLVPLEDALIWGSDAGKDAAPEIRNLIYRYDFRRARKEALTEIDKPAYYAARFGNGGIALASTFEPGFKRKVDESAELWLSRDGEKWEIAVRLPFQPSGRRYGTKYAMICLPLGDSSDGSVYLTPLNVKDHDFKLLACPLKK